MSTSDYLKAYKLGKKIYRFQKMHGETPYLPALETLAGSISALQQESLGTIEIPLEQVVGTYATGRQPTFTQDFLPLMPEKSEFAQKWVALSDAHINEGIHDPIKVYEYYNQFYVIEGHKRVSVLRYFEAVSCRAEVTRVYPLPADTLEYRLYQDFLPFYQLTSINYLWFTQENGFSALLSLLPNHNEWSSEERMDFRSFYARFKQAYNEYLKLTETLTVGDVMLIYLKVFHYESSKNKTKDQLHTELNQLSSEIFNRSQGKEINVVLKPTEKKPLIVIPSLTPLRVAFIHDKTPEESSWIYSHELGRKDLEGALKEQIITTVFSGVGCEQQAAETISDAAQKYDLVFTTSPRLLNASVQAALAIPKANILNCSLNTSHPSVRTYYARIYEAKFLMGVIAGCQTDRIGYVADYPIHGIISSINAFALGVQLVNPRAKVVLKWKHTLSDDRAAFDDLSFISDTDTFIPGSCNNFEAGLYRSTEFGNENAALPVWHWGKLYEKLIKDYRSGRWSTSDTRAINYWWGMDSDVIDLICSRSLPEGTQRLVSLLRDNICAHTFTPFSGNIRTQTGTVLDYQNHIITSNEIIEMDWLAENIIGSFPTFEELKPEAQQLVRIQEKENT